MPETHEFDLSARQLDEPVDDQRRRETAPYPRRYRSALTTGHEWADTDSFDEDVDVNSADLQGFVRSELEALSAGIDDFPANCRVFLLTKSLQNWREQRWICQLFLKYW